MNRGKTPKQYQISVKVEAIEANGLIVSWWAIHVIKREHQMTITVKIYTKYQSLIGLRGETLLMNNKVYKLT